MHSKECIQSDIATQQNFGPGNKNNLLLVPASSDFRRSIDSYVLCYLNKTNSNKTQHQKESPKDNKKQQNQQKISEL